MNKSISALCINGVFIKDKNRSMAHRSVLCYYNVYRNAPLILTWQIGICRRIYFGSPVGELARRKPRLRSCFAQPKVMR